jgi:tetratricopeptide (TPR) repeat protein
LSHAKVTRREPERPRAPGSVIEARHGGKAPNKTPSAEVSQIAEESRRLAAALATLRKGGEPHKALRLLQAYERAFPTGALRAEANRAIVEAALAADATKLARRRLEHMPLEHGDAALLVTRGELRARAGDCRAASRDFSRYLDRSAERGTETLASRALWGRALCHQQQGQTELALADVDRLISKSTGGPWMSKALRLRAALQNRQVRVPSDHEILSD